MFDPRQIGSKGAAAAKLMFLQKRIADKKIRVEKDNMQIIVTGDGKLKRIEIDGDEQKDLMNAINEAIQQARKWSEGEMQGMMGEIGKIFK